MGWSLEGLSAITRCAQTFAQDGRIHVVDYTSADRFCLDGKRLVLAPGTGAYDASDSKYRTEIEGFSRILAHGQAPGGGSAWFEVRTKSGENPISTLTGQRAAGSFTLVSDGQHRSCWSTDPFGVA